MGHGLHTLQSSFGPTGTVIDWLRSTIVSDRQITPDGCLSNVLLIYFGVPPGSVVDPILVILYMVKEIDIIASYGFDCRPHAGNMQVYISVPSTMMDHFNSPNLFQTLTGGYR